MRLRGALLWEADGEPRRDEVLISDERPNGSGSPIVILGSGGQPRAESSDDLPPGSVLLLPPDASDRDIDLIEKSGYPIRRVSHPAVNAGDSLGDDFDDDHDLDAFEADRAARWEAIKAAEAELQEVTERLTRVLRQRHPQLFDSAGHLRRDEYARLMLQRTGGRKTLTREEILALEKAWTLPADAPGPVDAP